MNGTAQVLRDAADLIERDGWTRGRNERDGRHCVMGAIEVVMSYRAWNDAATVLRRHIGWNLTVWNDAQKSRAPVLRALRDCADHLDKEESS